MKGGRNDLKVSYYLKRIINDKIKLGFIFLLFLLPIMDLISKLVSIHHGATPMTPWSSTFLSLTSTSFIFHSLFFNFLPLYLLIISCDDCFEDCTTKYRNILISKWGKKDYVITNIILSFAKKIRKEKELPFHKTNSFFGGVFGLVKSGAYLIVISAVCEFVLDIMTTQNQFVTQLRSSVIIEYINKFNPLI